MEDNNKTFKVLITGGGRKFSDLIKDIPEDVKVEVPKTITERIEKIDSKKFFEIIKK